MNATPQGLALLAALLLATACATPRAYRFDLLDGGTPGTPAADGRQVLEDADVRVELRVDPTGERAILVEVTNRTDQVLQVEWTKVTMTRANGLVMRPRPDADLGWIGPGQKQFARLVPFALPGSGKAALAMEGQRFQLEVPMIVRRERRKHRYDFLVHVLKAGAR